MSNESISHINSNKLDGLASDMSKVLQLMEGEENAPGVLARLALIETVLFGRHGKDGLVTKVNFMWRAHVWLMCSLSAGFGFMLREFLIKIKI